MKLAIFGGDGLLGQSLITQAMSVGYSVTALTAKLPQQSLRKRLTLVQGEPVFSVIEETLASADAVLVIDDSQKDQSFTPAAMRCVVIAMQEHGLRRLIVATGAKEVADPITASYRGRWWQRRRGPSPEETITAVAQRSSLDWTILRSVEPAQGDGALQAQLIAVLSEVDFSKFILNQVTDVRYLHQSPRIVVNESSQQINVG